MRMNSAHVMYLIFFSRFIVHGNVQFISKYSLIILLHKQQYLHVCEAMHVESVDTVVVYFSFAFVIVIVYVCTCTCKCGQEIYDNIKILQLFRNSG